MELKGYQLSKAAERSMENISHITDYDLYMIIFDQYEDLSCQ